RGGGVLHDGVPGLGVGAQVLAHLLAQLLPLIRGELLELAPLGEELLPFVRRELLEGLEVLPHPRLLLRRQGAPAGHVRLDASLLVERQRLELAEPLPELSLLLLAHEIEARRRVVVRWEGGGLGLRRGRSQGEKENRQCPGPHGRPSFCSSSRCSTTSRSSRDRPTTS